MRVVNVEKRVDGVQGSRYLLELEVKKDDDGRLLRLSHHIYALHSHSRFHAWHLGNAHAPSQQVLCNPVGFKWNPAATVHIIVPGTQNPQDSNIPIDDENCVLAAGCNGPKRPSLVWTLIQSLRCFTLSVSRDSPTPGQKQQCPPQAEP